MNKNGNSIKFQTLCTLCHKVNISVSFCPCMAVPSEGMILLWHKTNGSIMLMSSIERGCQELMESLAAHHWGISIALFTRQKEQLGQASGTLRSDIPRTKCIEKCWFVVVGGLLNLCYDYSKPIQKKVYWICLLYWISTSVHNNNITKNM